ncbi:4-hydroxybenzoate polyprenyltransferase, mitochondrial-like [Papaver somniferum]|uniref:4-hydroxybenzoate polyprenyltransferase, mitochondrial-like n=1 Tax=Papaver somniferum TaxID=3469 RepID=UPI000E704D0C|nr:4-hydroxybenzoate polyprenyltransferase, mitochondrial-like [Papaver somniferum]
MASSFCLSSGIQSSSFSILPKVALISRQLRPVIPQPPLHLRTRETRFKICQKFSSSEAALVSCCYPSDHRTNPSTGSVKKEIANNRSDDGGKVIGKEEEVVCNLSTSWIDLHLPKAVRPYAHLARLHKLSPTWLFAWPCFWSITLASPSSKLLDIKMLVLFGIGSLFLRSVACVINDILDRDIDAKVERTKSRPLASGFLTPYQGLNFLVLLYLGFLLQLNNYCRVLGLLLLPLIFSYPLIKRLTFWPQAYLGVAFNWGALLGWAAIEGSLNYVISLPLYVSGVFWTLVYDTIYAHQDKEDDLRVGVKSTAILFGDQTKVWITGFGIASIITLWLSGYNASIGWPFYVSLIAASAQLAWQIWTVDLSNPADCSKKFLSNTWYGAIVFGGILFGRLVT